MVEDLTAKSSLRSAVKKGAGPSNNICATP
jgi:hypothetical protein